MNYKSLIIENNPNCVNTLKEYLKYCLDFKLIGEASNVNEAIKFIERNHIDILFVGVELPEITGIEFVRTLPNPPEVIFLSDYKEKAVDAYELNAIDFLLKPISFERFLKAVNKVRFNTKIQHEKLMKEEKELNVDQILSIRDNKKTRNIHFNDILYIEGMREYVKIHTKNGSIVIKNTLRNIEEKLPSDYFVRIHKSYIVSAKKVNIFTSSYVEISGKKISIGRIFRNRAVEILNQLSTWMVL